VRVARQLRQRVSPGTAERDVDRGGGEVLIFPSLDLSVEAGLLQAADELAALVHALE
jgi:hypothetical protein